MPVGHADGELGPIACMPSNAADLQLDKAARDLVVKGHEKGLQRLARPHRHHRTPLCLEEPQGAAMRVLAAAQPPPRRRGFTLRERDTADQGGISPGLISFLPKMVQWTAVP